MPCLDTSVVIDLMRGPRNPRFRAASTTVREVVLSGQKLHLSRVSQAELFAGAFRTSRVDAELEKVQRALLHLNILELTAEIAEEFGRITAELSNRGDRIGDIDALIAATCVSHRQPILTANPRHFRKVQGLEVLTYL